MAYKEAIKYGKNCIQKRNFHGTKESIDTNHVNADNILVSNKYLTRKKGFGFLLVMEIILSIVSSLCFLSYLSWENP